MSQQQLLLLILGVIVVGVAIAVSGGTATNCYYGGRNRFGTHSCLLMQIVGRQKGMQKQTDKFKHTKNNLRKKSRFLIRIGSSVGARNRT